MTKISVIIPFYNCEEFLEQSVRSVLRQSLEELEVICVDDGSADHSAEAVRRLMQEDSRIRLLAQENQGAGAARNLALENAIGKYISFLDADDCYVDRDALEKMYGICEEKQAAACVSRRWRMDDRETEVEPSFRKVERDGMVSYQDCQADYNFMNYLFRRELLEDGDIRFPSYRRFEDPPFLARALYKAGEFAVAETCLYRYSMPDAVSRFRPESMKDLLRGLTDNLVFARERGLDILFEKTVERLEYEYLYIILGNMAPEDAEPLNLLMHANQVICHWKEDDSYVARPLRTVLLYAGGYPGKMLDRVRREREIYLYGAGRLGQAFCQFLEDRGLAGRVKSFVVSELPGNRPYVRGIPVTALGDLPERGTARILVTAGGEKQEEMERYLEENNCGNYETVREEFLCLTAEEMEREGRLWRV